MCYIFCYFFQEYDNQAETLVSGLAISADDDDLDLSKFSFGLILLCENMCKHLYFFFFFREPLFLGLQSMHYGQMGNL